MVTRVLIVNKFLYPNGGSETYIFQVGKQLSRMGHSVQYFGMEHEGRTVGNDIGSYTSVMDFHSSGLKKLTYPFKIIYSEEARKKIRCVLDDFHPDVVHLNNFNFQLTPSILYEIRKYERQSNEKVKIVYTAHDSQLVCPDHLMMIYGSRERCERCLNGSSFECFRNKCIHGSALRSLLGSIEKELYRRLKTYSMIDVIICPSRFMKTQLDTDQVLRARTVWLQNFVNKPQQISDLPDKDAYVLYFGRYSEEKGLNTLLQACRNLPQIQFIFVGSGPMEHEVETLQNVKNVGFQQGIQLQSYIENAEFSVFPSECNENCPFTVMESIVSGTPVIGTDIGGVPELIRDGEDGELFQCGNADDLTERIKKIYQNKKLICKYRENCKNNTFMDISQYCEKLIRIYK